MADVTSIYGNPIKDAVARADIATNTQDISDLKDGLQELVGFSETLTPVKINGLNVVQNGTAYANSPTQDAFYIPVEKDVTYKWSTGRSSGSPYVRMAFSEQLPANGVSFTYIGQKQITTDTPVEFSFTAPSDGYICESVYINQTNSSLMTIEGTMEGNFDILQSKVETLKSATDGLGSISLSVHQSASWNWVVVALDTPIPEGSPVIITNSGSTTRFTVRNSEESSVSAGDNLQSNASYSFEAPFNIYSLRCYVSGTVLDFSLTASGIKNELNAEVDKTNGVACLPLKEWEVGSITGATGADLSINYVIRSKAYQKYFVEKKMVAISVNERISTVFAFKYNKNTEAFIERLGTDGQKYVILDSGFLYRFVCIASDDSITITTETLPDYLTGFYICGETLGGLLSGVSGIATDQGGVVYEASGQPKSVSSTLKGVITGMQAFAFYDGKYYSTDGSNLYEQDGNFNLLSTTSLALGHGNSLQLGSNGIAYASGWDDQKIYAVDLSQKTIVNTIILPTTGYTTAVVDDANDIAYILQRDTLPSTVSAYKLIVYDYANAEVVSEKAFARQFGGGQGMDFYEGKIFLAYGLGTSAVPCGLIVFDANGTILADYVLNIFESVEVEGVCYRRENKELLVSLANRNVFSIT